MFKQESLTRTRRAVYAAKAVRIRQSELSGLSLPRRKTIKLTLHLCVIISAKNTSFKMAFIELIYELIL